MTNQSERLITLKSGLDERELHILNIELDRRRKSSGRRIRPVVFSQLAGDSQILSGQNRDGRRIRHRSVGLDHPGGIWRRNGSREYRRGRSGCDGRPARFADLWRVVVRGFVHDPETGKRLQRKPGTGNHRLSEREEKRATGFIAESHEAGIKNRRLTSARISCPDSPPR